MDRSQSTSFQAVEDWLRGLGLLQYAQSFYDNGYEDIDTCKEINAEDLDVIGVKGDRDRNDILSAVQRLKSNLYFMLEAEPTEKPELVTFETLILKTKLKETMKTRNVQLIEPPYYNPDGTFGDLYPLAITLADDLGTHFNDVLEALEQLRKRQLPAQTYDVMNTENLQPSDAAEKRRSTTLTDPPPDYLDCETSNKNRAYSLSKYDTRATKSTTDLTKDINHERSHSAGSTNSKYKIHKATDPKGKGGRFSIFHRKDTVKSQKGVKEGIKELHHEFKADELSISQTEICDMLTKVKKNEMSQEEVLAAVKKRSASGGESKCSPVIGSQQDHSQLTHTGSLGKSKKGKINKNMIKRTPSATFYTSKDDTPYMIPAGETLERTRSGSSLGGDSLPDSTKSSPELPSKSGILSKIRSSIRKKGKNEGDDHNSSLSPSESLSSQENIALSDVSGKSSPEVKRNDNIPPAVPPNKPGHSEVAAANNNVYQYPTPILALASTTRPMPSVPVKPRDTKQSEGDWEVFHNDPSQQADAPLKIKEYTKYQDEAARRHSEDKSSQDMLKDDKVFLPGKGLQLDLNQSKLKPVPKAPPRLTKTSSSFDNDIGGGPKSPVPAPTPRKKLPNSQSTGGNGTPKAPPRSKKLINNAGTPGTPGTPVESLGIDDIGKKMDHLIAGLNDRLNDIDDNYVDDTQLDNLRKNSNPQPPPVMPSVKPTPHINNTKPAIPGAKPLTGKRPMLPPRPSTDTPPRKASVDISKTNISSDIDGLPSHGKLCDSNKHQKLFYEKENNHDTIETNLEKVSHELEQIRKESISSQNRVKGKSRFNFLPLKRILQKKLYSENIKIHEAPYTLENGSWHVPHALVKRYSDELNKGIVEIIKALEEIRCEQRTKTKPLVPYNETSIQIRQLPANHSLDDWLVHMGLPMFIEDLNEVQVTTIEDVYDLKEKDFKQIGVFHDNQIALLIALAKKHVESASIVYC